MKLNYKIKGLFMLGLLSLMSFASAGSDGLQIGVVDFRACLEKSYLGQQEQMNLDAMRNEMVSTLESKEKALNEVVEKLKNPELLDSLSPQAEEELQQKAAKLSEEMQMLQNQAYQALNQAQMKMLQTVQEQISKSAEFLAREHSLDVIVNQESCFYYKRPLDLTQLVIQELNRHFHPDSLTTKAEKNDAKADLEN